MEKALVLLIVSTIAALFTYVFVDSIDRSFRIADARISQHLSQMDGDVKQTLARK